MSYTARSERNIQAPRPSKPSKLAREIIEAFRQEYFCDFVINCDYESHERWLTEQAYRKL